MRLHCPTGGGRIGTFTKKNFRRMTGVRNPLSRCQNYMHNELESSETNTTKSLSGAQAEPTVTMS